MRKQLVFISIFLLSFASNAQVGYLGKRFTLTGGTSIATPIFNYAFQANNPQRLNNIYIFADRAVLPPELRLKADAVLTEIIQFSVGTSWRGLQNTGFLSYKDEVDFTNGSNSYVDSFQLKTNSLNLTASFKFFYEYAPIGKYFEVQGGMSRAVSDVYPTYSVSHIDHQNNIETIVSDKREPGTYINNFFNVSAGFGRTRMINKSLVLDYGFRATYVVGSRSFGPDEDAYTYSDFDYQEYFPEIISYIQLTNLQSSYAFEIYLNFGLCF